MSRVLRAVGVSYLAAASAALASYLVGAALGVEKVVGPDLVAVITGNYGMDGLLDFFLVVVPLLAVWGMWLGVAQLRGTSPGSWSLFLCRGLMVVLLVALFSQLVTPLVPFVLPERFQYIRFSVGVAPWLCMASAFVLLRAGDVPRRWDRTLALVGVSAPLWLAAIVPWSLVLNGISWAHFAD